MIYIMNSWTKNDITESYKGIHAFKRILIFTISKNNISKVVESINEYFNIFCPNENIFSTIGEDNKSIWTWNKSIKDDEHVKQDQNHVVITCNTLNRLFNIIEIGDSIALDNGIIYVFDSIEKLSEYYTPIH